MSSVVDMFIHERTSNGKTMSHSFQRLGGLGWDRYHEGPWFVSNELYLLDPVGNGFTFWGASITWDYYGFMTCDFMFQNIGGYGRAVFSKGRHWDLRHHSCS